MTLENGTRVGVIGGGPAGSFFSYFFLQMVSRVRVNAQVDMYEPRNLAATGPASCNMCGGIVSESLVQLLATEGINLPSTVVQRGIDSYVVHMDEGSVRIDPSGQEKRIAAVHRGGGPRGLLEKRWDGLDGFLIGLAAAQGAHVIEERVEGIIWENGKPRLTIKGQASDPYDLVVVAVGINGRGLKLLESLQGAYHLPRTRKTYICEFRLGADMVQMCLGNSMHVFLLNLPRLEFAALIPKGEYATLVVLGNDVDKALVESLLNSPEVKRCLPPGWSTPQDYCRCFPSINVRGPRQPFADRMVFIGDSGENRLYKDGIGGSYRTAKAAVFGGVSASDFRSHYWPVCRSLARDNAFGRAIFKSTHLIQAIRSSRRGILRMAAREQRQESGSRRLSEILWDTFTGSAPYRQIFLRTLHPLFLWRFFGNTVLTLFGWELPDVNKESRVGLVLLGRIYAKGETIVRQGDVGDCMYVIQTGEAEVIREVGRKEVRLALLAEGDFFGEMALFDQDVRSATVRAVSEVRAITVDKELFLRKVHEDPSLAFRIMRRMSGRIRELDENLATARVTAAGSPSAGRDS